MTDSGVNNGDRALITARDLRKTYTLGGGTIHALDGVSFDIRPGEMLAITGASGSGKSTLMHVLGCLDRVDSGTYLLAGEDVSELDGVQLAAIRNRRIGFVFQTFNLLPRLSALENVEMPLLYAGEAEAKDHAAAALDSVGLTRWMKHEPSQLSGGQRQRVAVARALVTNPDIILADEPTGNLDSRTSEEIMALLTSLNKQGRTIIIVTHEQDIAAHCRSRIQLCDGRIIETEAA
jgi:putative ABC transport system ATP-binding protein